VIEDAPAGLAAGRAAGCATLAVTTTHSAGELEAEVVVAGLSEVNFQIVDDRVIVRRARL
jgi:sugar-phosphatase